MRFSLRRFSIFVYYKPKIFKQMKNFKKNILSIALLLPFVFSSCTKDVPAATVVNKVFALSSVGTAGVSGTATVVEKKRCYIEYRIKFKNTVAGSSHPAHIHLNTAEGGDIALTLKPVDGTTGKHNNI
jgi:hypothetical protein